MSNEQNLISDLRDQNRALREENERLRKKSRLKLNAIGSDKCQINFTTPTIISESEVKHRLAESELVVKMAGEIAELKSQLIYSDYYKTQFKDLLMRHLELISTTAGLKTQLEDRGTDITELKSQVEDLQEELSDTRAQSNLKDWEIRFLKEDVKRLTAKLYEKRHFLQTRDTED